jgi:hypothetical protein
LKGARKLGIHIDLIPQNTAGRAHDCGMCQRGCACFPKLTSITQSTFQDRKERKK